MSKEKEILKQKLMDIFLTHPSPIGSTWWWHKKLYGKGYDSPDGYLYRRLLMLLNELHNEKKIKAIRTNDATIWYLPYPKQTDENEG